MATALAAIALASVVGSLFLWNLSPSLPRGLYRTAASETLAHGTIVAFEPPPSAAIVVARGYLPRGARLLKMLVALPGDHVCIDATFSVNARQIGPVLRRDSAGRPLDPYRFCGVVPSGFAFVATRATSSFDSRYFGPVPLDTLIPARPVWTF
jgi:conjugative transfer signal peptidase TraF